MRKNRNSFFAENNMNYQGFNPMAANVPYQNVSANSSFYSGQMPMPIGIDTNDYNERLAKIERQLNRLEHRIANLEGKTTKTTDDFESTNNNMYII